LWKGDEPLKVPAVKKEIRFANDPDHYFKEELTPSFVEREIVRRIRALVLPRLVLYGRIT